MKKILVMVIAVLCVASFACAQEQEAAKQQPLLGKILEVVVADPVKGVMDTTVTVGDEMGNPVKFTVTETTKVVDSALNLVTFNQLKSGDTVKVEAADKDGKKEAKSINVM